MTTIMESKQEFVISDTGEVITLEEMAGMLAYTICGDNSITCADEYESARVFLDHTEVQSWLLEGAHVIYSDDVITSYLFHRQNA